jgi:hypothetical protein
LEAFGGLQEDLGELRYPPNLPKYRCNSLENISLSNTILSPVLASFLPIFFLLFLVSHLKAGDPVAVAGKIVRNTDSTGATFIGLVNPRTLALTAVLQGADLDSRIDESVILHVEVTANHYLGLPVLNVIDLLPEYWQFPPNWDEFVNSFGGYTGFGRQLRADDYTVVPFEYRRAYVNDTGQLLPDLGSTFNGSFVPLPVVLQATSGFGSATVTWRATAGIRYDLLAAYDVNGPYHFVTDATRESSGYISLNVSTAPAEQFFRVRY